jgi:isopenicillin-N epimerase
MRELFLLDPAVTFLNHGSFGACPRPVFEVYQAWQRELERQPVDFLARRFVERMRQAREDLAAYVHCAPDDLVYVPNATTGVNTAARSLRLGPGDVVVASDHEYGACDRVWRFLAAKQGFDYVRVPLDVPVTTPAALVERLWAAVTPRTRVMYLSHLTSATALVFPVAEACARARQAGILTIVDGAHAPGQLPLDLTVLGADVYAGNCHKWLCAPKGAGFLYVRREVQPLIEPLVVSWGWQAEKPGPSRFIDEQELTGTRDIAAYLTVPAAIAFQAEHDWPAVRRRCHELVGEARRRLLALDGVRALHPDEDVWYAQMEAVELPPCDPEALWQRLYEQFRVEVPVYTWNGRPILRVSVQAYNRADDLDVLMAGLQACLDEMGLGRGR